MLCVIVLLAYRYFTLIDVSIDPITPLPLSAIPMGQYYNAAVVSNGEPCAKIGA